MLIPTYLAMTAGEISASQDLPEHLAWMACHFSAYSTGLSNCPTFLPPESLLMVNDRIPIWRHDPARILTQLQKMQAEFSPAGIVLDFQRTGCWETEQLTGILVKDLHCPVAVSECYATGLDCPVFLSAPPLCTPLAQHLLPWKGRDIWLEAALSGQILTVTPDGCTQTDTDIADTEELPFTDDALCCRYGFSADREKAVFTLCRGKRELESLLEQATKLGVSRAIGLFQQLRTNEALAP